MSVFIPHSTMKPLFAQAYLDYLVFRAVTPSQEAAAIKQVREVLAVRASGIGLSQFVRPVLTFALLGWANTKNWLRVLILTDISQSKDAHELVLLSAQRGMFLERLARDHDFWGFDPEGLLEASCRIAEDFAKNEPTLKLWCEKGATVGLWTLYNKPPSGEAMSENIKKADCPHLKNVGCFN
jgi:hypothetical protein